MACGVVKVRVPRRRPDNVMFMYAAAGVGPMCRGGAGPLTGYRRRIALWRGSTELRTICGDRGWQGLSNIAYVYVGSRMLRRREQQGRACGCVVSMQTSTTLSIRQPHRPEGRIAYWNMFTDHAYVY